MQKVNFTGSRFLNTRKLRERVKAALANFKVEGRGNGWSNDTFKYLSLYVVYSISRQFEWLWRVQNSRRLSQKLFGLAKGAKTSIININQLLHLRR